jgi:hypothetical protein
VNSEHTISVTPIHTILNRASLKSGYLSVQQYLNDAGRDDESEIFHSVIDRLACIRNLS